MGLTRLIRARRVFFLAGLILVSGLLPAQASALSREETISILDEVDQAERVPAGWTGSTRNCTVGTESQASLDATLQTVNNLRRMAGVRPVVFDRQRNREALAAALIMNAQGDLSHYPDPSWRCFSEEGLQGASTSNLYLGVSGASAMVGYVDDPGVPSLGHRHWLLNPAATEMGSGSTGDTNALSVVGDSDWSSIPSDKVVAWPPSGWVPKPWVFEDWSIQLGNGDTEIAGTPSIEVLINGAPTRVANFVANDFFSSAAGFKWQLPDLWKAKGTVTIDVSVTGLRFRDWSEEYEDSESSWRPLDVSYRVQAFDPFVRPKLRLKALSQGARRMVVQVNSPRVLGGRPATIRISRVRVRCAYGICLELGEKVLSSRSVALRPGLRLRVPSPKGRFRTRLKVSTKGWTTSEMIVRPAQVSRTFGG